MDMVTQRLFESMLMGTEGVKNDIYLDSEGRPAVGIGYDLWVHEDEDHNRDLQILGVHWDPPPTRTGQKGRLLGPDRQPLKHGLSDNQVYALLGWTIHEHEEDLAASLSTMSRWALRPDAKSHGRTYQSWWCSDSLSLDRLPIGVRLALLDISLNTGHFATEWKETAKLVREGNLLGAADNLSHNTKVQDTSPGLARRRDFRVALLRQEAHLQRLREHAIDYAAIYLSEWTPNTHQGLLDLAEASRTEWQAACHVANVYANTKDRDGHKYKDVSPEDFRILNEARIVGLDEALRSAFQAARHRVGPGNLPGQNRVDEVRRWVETGKYIGDTRPRGFNQTYTSMRDQLKARRLASLERVIEEYIWQNALAQSTDLPQEARAAAAARLTAIRARFRSLWTALLQDYSDLPQRFEAITQHAHTAAMGRVALSLGRFEPKAPDQLNIPLPTFRELMPQPERSPRQSYAPETRSTSRAAYVAQTGSTGPVVISPDLAAKSTARLTSTPSGAPKVSAPPILGPSAPAGLRSHLVQTGLISAPRGPVGTPAPASPPPATVDLDQRIHEIVEARLLRQEEHFLRMIESAS